MVEYVESPEFDELIVQVIRTEEPDEKQERLLSRSRSAVAAWASDRRAAAAGAHTGSLSRPSTD
jgi:hypothetical protein